MILSVEKTDLAVVELGVRRFCSDLSNKTSLKNEKVGTGEPRNRQF